MTRQTQLAHYSLDKRHFAGTPAYMSRVREIVSKYATATSEHDRPSYRPTVGLTAGLTSVNFPPVFLSDKLPEN